MAKILNLFKSDPKHMSKRVLDKWKQLGPIDLTKVCVKDHLKLVRKSEFYFDYCGQVNSHGK